MRVKRAIARDRKTGSQFPTLKTANNRGLVEGKQSEEYPDAPQAERIGWPQEHQRNVACHDIHRQCPQRQMPNLPEEQPVGKRRPDATETYHQEPDASADAEQTLPENM